MTTDVELVERSRRRDTDAFGALVSRHQQLVFGVALARCHDPALAEDVAQDAFVTAWRDLDRLRDADQVGTWVAGIARNLASSAVRTRARRERVQLEPALDIQTPEQAAVEREDRELLHRALAEIPDAHRETLVLYYLEGHSISQIARSLSISEDVVKQRMSRGRRALRDNVATRVETVLGRTRLRPAFGATVIAALSTTKKAAAGSLVMWISAKKLVLACAAVAITGGTLWIVLRTPEVGSAPAVASSVASAPSEPHLHKRSNVHVERLPDKAARDRLVTAIHDAQVQRAATGTTASYTPVTMPPALPHDKDESEEFVRAAVQDILPLLRGCYQRGLLRDRTLAGDVMVDFTIEGEPEIGGIVSQSEIDGSNSSLEDPTVRQCIEQTMYSIRIDPPANGGKLRVRYPFAFSTD